MSDESFLHLSNCFWSTNVWLPHEFRQSSLEALILMKDLLARENDFHGEKETRSKLQENEDECRNVSTWSDVCFPDKIEIHVAYTHLKYAHLTYFLLCDLLLPACSLARLAMCVLTKPFHMSSIEAERRKMYFFSLMFFRGTMKARVPLCMCLHGAVLMEMLSESKL